MNACSTSYNVLHKHYLALSLSSNNPYLYLTQIVAEPSIYLTWTFFLNRPSIICTQNWQSSSISQQIFNSHVLHFYASKPSLLYKMYQNVVKRYLK